MAQEMRLVGGARPQRRRSAVPATWTRAREQAFIEALAESCNVSFAAARAGVSSSAAYRRRARDAGFRASWDRAVAIAYQQLELMLLDRALKGAEAAIAPAPDGRAAMARYDDRQALALLKFHRERAEESERTIDPTVHDEAVERIIARLQRLSARAAGQVETKALRLRGRMVRALLCWTLARATRALEREIERMEGRGATPRADGAGGGGGGVGVGVSGGAREDAAGAGVGLSGDERGGAVAG